MCTLALYLGVFKDYPLIVAANRDEFYCRPSAEPQVLVRSPLVFGGKDVQAGGTWLGVNQHGLLIGVLNRRSESTSDHVSKRSRGLLCLDVLKARDLNEAMRLLKHENASAYLPFNLVMATTRIAYVAYNNNENMEIIPLDKGLHVVSNTSIFDPRSEKLGFAYSLFSTVTAVAGNDPNSFFGEDGSLGIGRFKKALSSHSVGGDTKDPRAAICVHAGEYGTVSSSVIFCTGQENRFDYYHSQDSPCRSEYQKYISLKIA